MATHTIWITDKGFARLEAIWSAWTQHALLPAFFTTVETLILGTGRLWHPWNRRWHLLDGCSVWVWHDMYDRPHSLRPWDLEEATCLSSRWRCRRGVWGRASRTGIAEGDQKTGFVVS